MNTSPIRIRDVLVTGLCFAFMVAGLLSFINSVS